MQKNQKSTAAPQKRLAGGRLSYLLQYKKVKNLNLRVRGGEVWVSAPFGASLTWIDSVVLAKEEWIQKALAKKQEAPPLCDVEKARAYLEEVHRQMLPLVADFAPPGVTLVVKPMKSRWGVCHLKKTTITLNSQLLAYPRAAAEYVVLHEYVHFLHPDHQRGFHAEMAKRMPDYRARRALLRAGTMEEKPQE